MKILAPTVILIGLLSSSLVHGNKEKSFSDMKTAKWMLSACSATLKMADQSKLSEEEFAMALLCLGYLQGFQDAMPLFSMDEYRNVICIPKEGLSNEQVARIFVKWLRNNPEGLHNRTRTELFISLLRSFPCR